MSSAKLREKLTIDWAELKREYASAARIYSLEDSLARLVKYFALMAFLLINLIGLLDARLYFWELMDTSNFDIWQFLVASTFSVFAYGLYLGRDKDIYQDWDHQALTDIKADELDNWDKIELNDFLDRDLYQLLGKHAETGVLDLLSELVELPSVKQLLVRLGVEDRAVSLSLQKLAANKIEWEPGRLDTALERAFVTAWENSYKYIDEQALFISLLLNDFSDLCREWELKSEALYSLLSWTKLNRYREKLANQLDSKRLLLQIGGANQSLTSVYSPMLERYCQELTQSLKSSPELANFSYRLETLEEMESHLARLEGMVLLVGQPGSGKTTLIRSFVTKLLAGDVPVELKLRRVMEVNVTQLLASMKSAADVAKVLEQIFVEQEKTGDIILVIDDLDEIFSLPGELQQEVATILARQLQQKQVKLIATVTPKTWQNFLVNDANLSSSFEVLQLPEPSLEEMIQILIDHAKHLESKTGISANYSALARIAELAPSYEFNRALPDKALDIYRELLDAAKERREDFVSVTAVDEYLAKKSNLNLGAAGAKTTPEQSELLLNLESELEKYVVGQKDAIEAVAKALRRARLNLNVGNSKPVASFLFYGPTGVGKTETAKTIARVYFGDEKLLFRLDMSQYQQAKDIEQLVGYTSNGDFVEGILSRLVTQQPFSVILLDELEKANRQVVDLFLQILDNAEIKDASGRKLDFSHSIIIATSNAGSKLISDQVNVGKSYKQIKPAALERLKAHFRVEFLNRFDGVIMFHPLSLLDAEKIATMLLAQQKEVLKQKGIEFIYSDSLAKRMVEKGYDKQFGARSLKRTITETVSDEVAKAMLSGQLKSGDMFSLE